MDKQSSPSATQNVFREMLGKIQAGRWCVGAEIPSERMLIDQFGVSRIAIREALSMLRGLGVVDVGHGRRTRVSKVDSETFGKLLPLMLASGGQQSLDQVFEVRLAIESRTAYLAAERHTEDQMQQLRELVERFRRYRTEGREEATSADLAFHLLIARMSGNPLFPILLEALAGFVTYAQEASCKDDAHRSRRAVLAHESIADALDDRDAERARVEMEAHLRYSATRRISNEAVESLDGEQP